MNKKTKDETTEVSQELNEAPKVEESTSGSTTPEKVEVEKSTLDRLVKRLDDQEKQISTLTKVAPKDRLARLTPKGKIGRSVRVGTVDGKLVVGWKCTSNYVNYRSGNREEDQRSELTLEDGTTKEVEIHEFHDVMETVEVPLILEKCTYHLDEKNIPRGLKNCVFEWKGKEITLESTFINP